MDASKIESGLQLFSRLNHRPSIKNLNLALFTENGPFPNEFVEICGSPGTGKTLLVMDLLARCILPLKCNGVDLPGKNCGAIIINTEHHFDMLRLINIMEFIINKSCDKVVKLSQSSLANFIKSSLSNLIVLNCYDALKLQMTFYNLEKILSDNCNIGLVVMDNILSYYWDYRNTVGIISLHSYHKKVFESLQIATRNSNVVVMYTKTEIAIKNPQKGCTQQITYKIVLEEHENKFQARVITKESLKTVPYAINTTIIF